MTSLKHGTNISEAEVTGITRHGIWLLVKEKEYFLLYEEFPWFKQARIDEVHNVQLLHEHYLHWPEPDIDIAVASINVLERYLLIAKVN